MQLNLQMQQEMLERREFEKEVDLIVGLRAKERKNGRKITGVEGTEI